MMDEFEKIVKQIGGVVRARAGFWVKLDGKGGRVAVDDSLAGTVVAVQKAQGRAVRQAVRADGVAVVLAGDGDASRLVIFDGLVGAAMAERKLFRLRAARECHQLMPETDAHHRDFRRKETRCFLNDRCVVGGIAGAVGKEHSLRMQRQNLLRRKEGGNRCHPAAAPDQLTDQILLGSKVPQDNMGFPLPKAFRFRRVTSGTGGSGRVFRSAWMVSSE